MNWTFIVTLSRVAPSRQKQNLNFYNRHRLPNMRDTAGDNANHMLDFVITTLSMFSGYLSSFNWPVITNFNRRSLYPLNNLRRVFLSRLIMRETCTGQVLARFSWSESRCRLWLLTIIFLALILDKDKHRLLSPQFPNYFPELKRPFIKMKKNQKIL